MAKTSASKPAGRAPKSSAGGGSKRGGKRRTAVQRRAIVDNFATAFTESRGKVDPRLKLGF
jgi:hypothetical protein